MKNNMEAFKQSIAIWNIRLPDHRSDTPLCRSLLTGEELERAARAKVR